MNSFIEIKRLMDEISWIEQARDKAVQELIDIAIYYRERDPNDTRVLLVKMNELMSDLMNGKVLLEAQELHKKDKVVEAYRQVTPVETNQYQSI